MTKELNTGEPVAYGLFKDGDFIDAIHPDEYHRIQGSYDTPLYIHPSKELHLSLQKNEDGELVAVTYTDEEHRIVEVLWEKPPAKELTDEEKKELWNKCRFSDWDRIYEFADAILKRAGEK